MLIHYPCWAINVLLILYTWFGDIREKILFFFGIREKILLVTYIIVKNGKREMINFCSVRDINKRIVKFRIFEICSSVCTKSNHSHPLERDIIKKLCARLARVLVYPYNLKIENSHLIDHVKRLNHKLKLFRF